ncbi:MAG TPA: TonB-dependent receptor [Mucilaginibacter sp.]|jgi:vitamin B12 transporter|nr:TonB-dependent receptor [Mucilaginibacter sp.]
MKKKFVFVAAGLGLVQLALLSTAARAQDTTRVLDSVQVTATRSPKKLAETGRVLTIITAKDIARAQGETLPQLLNNVAGITFSGANNAPGISSSLYLRGEATGNTLVLVDGFPVNNASAIDNSYDLNAFPLDQIDHIEILKGSGSTLYGSDAVAGVINIITKHAAGQGLKTNVGLSGGTYDTFKEFVGINGNLGKTGIAINLSNTDSKGFPAATDTTGKAHFSDDGFHQRAVNINLNQQVSDKFMLMANLQTTYNTGDLPFGAFQEDGTYTYNNTFLNGGIGAKWLLPKGSLLVNVSQNNVWNNYNDPPSVLLNDSTRQVSHTTGRITDAEAVLNYNLGPHFDLTSGADFKYSRTDQFSLYTTEGYTPPPSIINGDTAHNSITSVYSSLFYRSKIFRMELGGRFNHHSKYGSNFTYAVNPSVMLFDRLKVFATAASAYKTPTLYQLFSQYGNVNLKPETTDSYEAGFDWEIVKNTLSFNTEFYKYRTSDVIYFFTDPVTFNSIYKNGEHENDQGFESELKFKQGKFNASAYWAYVTGNLTDENGVTTNYLIRRPKNTFGVNVYYDFTSHFSAGLNYKLTGARPDDDFSTGSIVTLKAYSLLDAHFQYTANTHISLFADLKNLLDEKYTDWVGYNTARFNFMAGIRYQIN